MNTAMNTALRPMSTGQVLDRTFNLYRKYFMLFFGIGLLPPALKLLFQLTPLSADRLVESGSPWAVNAAIAALIGAVVLWVAWVLGYSVSQAATVFAVSAVHLGRDTSVKESYGKVRGRFLRVVGVVVLTFLIVVISVAVIIGTAAIVGVGLRGLGTGGGALAGLVFFGAFIVSLIVAIYFALRFAVAIPACALENLKIIASLRRSTQLTKNDRGRIFVIYFLFVVLVSILALSLGAVLGIVAPDEKSFLAQASILLAGFVAEALAGPMIAIAISLVYYDERVRKEAFDLQLMMGTLDKSAAAAASATV